MSVTVELSRDEMIFAAQGGATRRIDALLKGRREYFSHKEAGKLKPAYFVPQTDLHPVAGEVTRLREAA